MPRRRKVVVGGLDGLDVVVHLGPHEPVRTLVFTSDDGLVEVVGRTAEGEQVAYYEVPRALYFARARAR